MAFLNFWVDNVKVEILINLNYKTKDLGSVWIELIVAETEN